MSNRKKKRKVLYGRIPSRKVPPLPPSLSLHLIDSATLWRTLFPIEGGVHVVSAAGVKMAVKASSPIGTVLTFPSSLSQSLVRQLSNRRPVEGFLKAFL
jgi:hypothetical protein